MQGRKIYLILLVGIAIGVITIGEMISVPINYSTIYQNTYGPPPRRRFPEGTAGTIFGHVYNEQWDPIAGIIVEALRNNEVFSQDISDNEGEFFMTSLPPGLYDLRARQLLYRTSEQQVFVPTAGAEETAFFLEPSHFHAVIVGISDYINFPIFFPDTVLDLNYADDDAISVDELLSSRNNWDSAEMVLLLDQWGTKSNIESNIIKRVNQMAPGDYMLFYFAGHGTNDGNTGYLVAADALNGEDWQHMISVQELYQWLGGAPGPKAIILDSCYSGRFTYQGDASFPFLIQQVPITDDSIDIVTDPWLDREMAPDSSVIMTAANWYETAVEMYFPRILSGHGIFTFQLLRYWESNSDPDGDGFMSLEECYPTVSWWTTSSAWLLASHSQHPQILDNMVLGDLSAELDLVSVYNGPDPRK